MTTPAWTLCFFILYLVAMEWLSRKSAAGGASFAAFAAGRAELGPLTTALVLTACHVSTATFAINPGLVYRDGLPALLGLTIPVAVGITAALALLGPGFRASSIGPDGEPQALTMPQWIGARFQSPGLRRLFSLLVLALFSYLVMVIVGAAYVVASMAGVSFPLAVALMIGLAAVVRASLASGALFLAISLGALVVGLAARADLGAGLKQDQVASLWVAQTFSPPLAALVGMALIAGAVSTLDGLFLALGTTVAHDLVRPLMPGLAGPDADRRALRVGQAATVLIGALALACCVDPPDRVWVIGSMGAYAMVAAACPAVIGGCFEAPRAGAGWIAAAAVAGPLVHVSLYVRGISKNPNATGTAGLLCAAAIVAIGTIRARMRAREAVRPVEAASTALPLTPP